MPKSHPNALYATVAGFCLIAIGLCLARFAFTPLIPSLIDSGWIDRAQAGYLGGFNCLGYITACLLSIWLPRVTGIRLVMRCSLVLVIISLTMCAWDFGFVWLAIGRFLTGLAGAAFVIHTPSVMLRCINDRVKSICGGIAFTGAGVLIVVVSLLLPVFITNGPRDGWLFQAAITLVLAIIGWHLVSWAPHEPVNEQRTDEKLATKPRLILFVLATAYVLAAIGVVPHSLFLSDYLHRDLGTSISASSSLFALFGIGAIAGALTSGIASKFLGNRLSLLINYLLGVIAVAMVLLFKSVPVVTASAALIGFFLLQCVPLTSMRTREVVGLPRHPQFWGWLTLSFGLGLVIGSYGMSALLSIGFEYIDLFKVAEVSLIVAFLLTLWSWFRYKKIIDLEEA